MKLSVIIPAYNRASLLPITLRSLLAQGRVADEILVVDDGSTDGTAEAAEMFGPPVRVIRQANQGPGAARSRGLAAAQGELIHFFDSDDLALPNLHQGQIEALEKSCADLAYSPWVKVSLGLEDAPQSNPILQAHGLPAGNLIRALLTNWSIVPICCLIRRSVIERTGGFPEDLRTGEDQLFFLRLLLAGATVVHSPGTLVFYRADNDAKLSDPRSPAALARRHQDWARFLLAARSECQHFGIDPCRWFGFRRRAWEARLDLEVAGLFDDPLCDALAAMTAASHPDSLYALHRTLQRKRDGLQARLVAGRAHRSFRTSRWQLSDWQHLARLIATQP